MDKFIFLVLVNLFFYEHASCSLSINDPLSLSNHALDLQLYKDVLNPELCQEQLNYLRRNDTTLLARFIDAGIRTPKGLMEGNFLDMGNYYQCLGIRETASNLSIEGKYCSIRVPFNQDLHLPTLSEFPGWSDIEWSDLEWPDIPWPELNPKTTRITKETYERIRNFKPSQPDDDISPYMLSIEGIGEITLNLALCIPKACTTREAFEGMMLNVTAIGFQYEDQFCRLPNDKPWVIADYLAIALFGLIGVLTALSTAYDVRHNILLKRNPKQINKVLQSFSIYTNTRRLVTYTPLPGALECLDGIRVLAMLWVIVGHTYVSQFNDLLANPLDAFDWMMSFQSLWITAAPITVDTFFLVSGMLVVYTTAGKITRLQLFKNLHLFYLNRLLRMFPILAAFILIQASVLNRINDGPHWESVIVNTNKCRVFWWTTLLHVQNFVTPGSSCLPHAWYLAIDVQLHILSPLVLIWVLGTRRRTAWSGLTLAMIVSIVPATIYNFIMEFPSAPVVPSRIDGQAYYLRNYYINTLTRCSPFFVGMIYGYLLHLCKGRIVLISRASSVILWACAIILSTTVIVSTYPTLQLDWDNQTVDSIINSFSRPAWALAVGWLIFACVHGYGGPINWLLSLKLWKVPSRLSYAMYISHYPMMFVVNSKVVSPVYFTVSSFFYRFLADLSWTMLVSLALTLFVDSPCSTLIKHFLPGPKRQQKPSMEDETKNEQLNGRINRAYVNDTKSDNNESV